MLLLLLPRRIAHTANVDAVLPPGPLLLLCLMVLMLMMLLMLLQLVMLRHPAADVAAVLLKHAAADVAAVLPTPRAHGRALHHPRLLLLVRLLRLLLLMLHRPRLLLMVRLLRLLLLMLR